MQALTTTAASIEVPVEIGGPAIFAHIVAAIPPPFPMVARDPALEAHLGRPSLSATSNRREYDIRVG